MLYPQEVIEEVRMGNDIVEVISGYVPLKQKGSNHFGLCPFHNEKTPSFSVSADKQMYYCFGCGASGNVFSFVMQMENDSFPEAVKRLAQRIHYTLPEADMPAHIQKRAEERAKLIDIHRVAARYFYSKLNAEEGRKAAAYINNRGISPKIQKKFGLGYAPLQRDGLFAQLMSEGYDIQLVLASGLVMEDKNTPGRYYDRFFNRLMFPIFDVSGRVIGFGGRILEAGEPKYLNSPDTPLFDKGKNLYGLNYARMARSREIILVEGYMDVLALYQAGFCNVSAALGTAFTADHALLLRKYADSVLLLFDSDEAGTKAALRAIPILVKGGLSVKVLQVTDVKDPDEYIKIRGAEAFRSLLQTAQSHVDFEIAQIRKAYDLAGTDGMIGFTKEAAKLLSGLTDEIERDGYVQKVAAESGISRGAIEAEIQKRASAPVKPKEKRNKTLTYAEQNKLKEKGITEAKKELLFLIATHNLQPYVRGLLLPEEMGEAVYTKLLDLFYDAYSRGSPLRPAEMVNYFDSLEEQTAVSEIFAGRQRIDDMSGLEKQLNDLLRRVKQHHMERLIREQTDLAGLTALVEAKRNLEKLYITISDG